MTQLTDRLDLPERIQKSQFVVTLEKGVGELPAASVVKDCLTTAGDGKSYKTQCFSLPMSHAAARTGGPP